MIIPSFNDIKKVTDSRYSLVMLASKRAKQLVNGSEPLVEINSSKPVSIALEEIMEGKITFGEPMSDKEYYRLMAEKMAEANDFEEDMVEIIDEAADLGAFEGEN